MALGFRINTVKILSWKYEKKIRTQRQGVKVSDHTVTLG